MELNSLYIDTIDEKHDYLQMMSAPDHTAVAGPQHNYVNCPKVASDVVTSSPNDGSGIFSPRINAQENTRFQFPSPSAAKIGKIFLLEFDEIVRPTEFINFFYS